MTAPAAGERFRIPSECRADVADKLWGACVARAQACAACQLCSARNTVVFGEGNRHSSLMFVGEGPGGDEDAQGRPFVGKAGQLLTQILAAAGIAREDVYITNVVKCRPPGNRDPLPEEMAACDAYLQTQILLVRPALMVLLGSTPTKWLLKTTSGITKLRGKWFNWRGIAVMPMFHPSYLLRYPDGKKQGSPKHLSWVDIQEVKRQWENVKEKGRLEDVEFA